MELGPRRLVSLLAAGSGSPNERDLLGRLTVQSKYSTPWRHSLVLFFGGVSLLPIAMKTKDVLLWCNHSTSIVQAAINSQETENKPTAYTWIRDCMGS